MKQTHSLVVGNTNAIKNLGSFMDTTLTTALARNRGLGSNLTEINIQFDYFSDLITLLPISERL